VSGIEQQNARSDQLVLVSISPLLRLDQGRDQVVGRRARRSATMPRTNALNATTDRSLPVAVLPCAPFRRASQWPPTMRASRPGARVDASNSQITIPAAVPRSRARDRTSRERRVLERCIDDLGNAVTQVLDTLRVNALPTSRASACAPAVRSRADGLFEAVEIAWRGSGGGHPSRHAIARADRGAEAPRAQHVETSS